MKKVLGLVILLPLLILTTAMSAYANELEDSNYQYLNSDGVNVVHPGQILCIRLRENRTTPYHWNYSISDATLVELVSDAYQTDDNPQGADGVGGTHTYYFRAVRAGSCTIQLNLAHVSEDAGEALQTETYAMIIEDALGAKGEETEGLAKTAETADTLLIKQIDELLTLSKEELIEKLGPDYEVGSAGPEGAMEGYYYDDLGMAFAFYPDSDTVELIDCYPNFRIYGVGEGSLFSEIKEALGDSEIIKTWMELPIYTVYMVQYHLGNASYHFVAFEEDAPVHLLRISQMPSTAAVDDGIFERIAGNTFSFSSGIGAWSTEIVVSEDGSFTGHFYDADMGDGGDDYPNGTLYECHFTGRLTVSGRIDQYTWELRLAALDIEEDKGVERIIDGVRSISADAYGIADGDVFMLYCPGRETVDLSEEFLEWMCMPNAWREVPETLPFYGLYNIKEGAGFFSSAER